MSELKQYLKLAKAAISNNDPDDALDHVRDALKCDRSSYVAYLFQGKANQLKGDLESAKISFEKAIAIDEFNVLAWKGLYQVVKSGQDYPAVFRVFSELARLQAEQSVPLVDLLKDLNSWLADARYKQNPSMYEAYLRSIIPGTSIYELVGNHLGKASDNLKSLLELEKAKVSKSLVAATSRERIKLGRVLNTEAKLRLCAVSWTVYLNSDIDSLYEQFLNVCDDEDERFQYQDEQVKLRYELLKLSPEKVEMGRNLRQLIDDMVFLKTKSVFCWNLYFDWADFESLSDIPADKIIFYLKTFPDEGLALVLFALVESGICAVDRNAIVAELVPSKTKFTMRGAILEADEEEILKEFEDEKHQSKSGLPSPLTPGEVLSTMLGGYASSHESVLANVIICEYYTQMREFQECSVRCPEAISLLADVQRFFGINLVHTKEHFLCCLALIYTHHEAPKNFPRAVQLYERVLQDNPANLRAKIGLGIIMINENKLAEARELLGLVYKDHPDNHEAVAQYGWCLVKLGEYEKGRELLEKSLMGYKGLDTYSRDTSASIKWKISQSYLQENDQAKDMVEKCYEWLVDSLKDSENYAPSYTGLGVLFHEYFHDNARAQKCFFKAFELDEAEVEAARYLTQEAAANNEWDIAEVICNRVINSQAARRLLLRVKSAHQDAAWPYRTLGCSELNKQNDAKAIEWFQTALRMEAMDFNCWVGLGEAYFNCGRLDAAIKVFRHVKTDDSWLVNYMLGMCLCQMGEFEEGLPYLAEEHNKRPQEACILNALYECNVEFARSLVTGGFLGRAVDSNLKAIEYLRLAAEIDAKSQGLWKSMSETLELFLNVQQHASRLPFESVKEIIEHAQLPSEANADELCSLQQAEALFEAGRFAECAGVLHVLSRLASMRNLGVKAGKHIRSVLLYNLALAYLRSASVLDAPSFYAAAIESLKKAIQLEGDNANFWAALGNAYASSSPVIAQHCFIKAISLDGRDASIWTNLATVYLMCKDYDLAQDTFLRAQLAAPLDSLSWLGNALSSEAKGKAEEASRLFTHAYILSNGQSPLAQVLYAMSISKNLVGNGNDPNDIEVAQEYSVSNLAMERYLKFFPLDVNGLQVALTIAERCQDFSRARDIGERLCSVLEKQFESSEAESVLISYASAKTQLARVYLGASRYEDAVQNAQIAIDLFEGVSSQDSPEIDQIILSSRVVFGVGFFFNGEFDSALDQFKLILAKHSKTKRLVILVSQVLYAFGTGETKQASLDQLFEFIEANGSNLLVVLTLGAITIAENLADYYPAIKEELEGLNLAELIGDNVRAVPRMLTELNRRIDADTNNLDVWRRSAVLFPGDYQVWKRLNQQMALDVVTLSGTKITSGVMAEANLLSGTLRGIQRSILLAPQLAQAEAALTECLAQ